MSSIDIVHQELFHCVSYINIADGELFNVISVSDTEIAAKVSQLYQRIVPLDEVRFRLFTHQFLAYFNKFSHCKFFLIFDIDEVACLHQARVKAFLEFKFW